jgi:hypothetical protein
MYLLRTPGPVYDQLMKSTHQGATSSIVNQIEFSSSCSRAMSRLSNWLGFPNYI